MTPFQRTVFFKRHEQLGAGIAEFGGWEMPIQYPDGILAEHIATREGAGIFDVSHMGRLFFKGRDTIPFLQHVLTNNAQALAVGQSQYTLIQNENGGALDDAYLYRFTENEYLLVVNASNREKDVAHLGHVLQNFSSVKMVDKTFEMAMISLQGPLSETIIEHIASHGALPEPGRNHLSIVRIDDSDVLLARTGYTGEPLGFELFIATGEACKLWDKLIAKGAVPVGLGARDTLRLEACLPLYGHELGVDHEGREIPLFASRLAKFAVSFSELKGAFIGRKALAGQHAAFKRILDHDFSDITALPRMIMPLAITGKGIARAGYRIFCNNRHVGYVTSGTSVPYRLSVKNGLEGRDEHAIKTRPVALALLDSNITKTDALEIEIRKKRCEAVVVAGHMSSEAPPYVQAIVHNQGRSNKRR